MTMFIRFFVEREMISMKMETAESLNSPAKLPRAFVQQPRHFETRRFNVVIAVSQRDTDLLRILRNK